jgi:hypothetical protein
MAKIAPSTSPDMDYAPKKLTRGETLGSGVKFSAFAGFIFFLFWLIEKYVY